MKKFIFFLCIFCNCALFATSVDPHLFVNFGATGDLTQRKLIPALYSLFKDERLPDNFVYIGLGRGEKTHQEFQEEICQSLQHYVPKQFDESSWQRFKEKCFYFRCDFNNAADFSKLNAFLSELETRFKTNGNRLYYLATQPSAFAPIVEKLDEFQLITPSSKVVIEKPFGRNLESALTLQQEISKHLEDKQIYLIDHYLGKEMVQNLLTLRFHNPLFEVIWNNQHIEHLQITLAEDLGIGTRGNFWEETGLLRDMVQNHLLQLIALITMERPVSFDADSIRAQKVKAIQSIRPFELAGAAPTIIRGQYSAGIINGASVKGYREEELVDPRSMVETFAAAKVWIDNERWEGVPLYIRAGKRLAKKTTEIIVTFKSDSLHPENQPNSLIIRIQPEEEIFLSFHSKTPGLDKSVRTYNMHIHYPSIFKERIPEAYENLLYESMAGNHENFASLEEILASWKLFDPVLNHWKKNQAHYFPNYLPGSWGPQEADLILQENHQWHNHKE